jgi:hypothetical protein
MSKILINAFFVIVLCGYAAALYGADQNPEAISPGPPERFGRGMINIISSPLEIPAQMYLRASYQKENIDNPFAIMGGFIEGIPMGLLYFPWRLTAGLYDLCTIFSSSHNRSIISPDYLSFSEEPLEESRNSLSASW